MKIILLPLFLALAIAFSSCSRTQEVVSTENGTIDISYISQTSSLIQPLVVELSHVALKRKHGFVHYAPIGLSSAFRVLKKEGKATDEEVEAVENLENNMYVLANLIKKINKIKSLED